MKIRNHRLVQADGSAVAYVPSPNVGGALTPGYLVMHYTTGSSAEGAIAWFKDAKSRASAHLVIGRDGAITQMVPFNRIAWHAGVSYWDGRTGLNQYAIGIELDNAGVMERVGNRWVGMVNKRPYPDDDVLVANHKHDRPGTPPRGWHEYTPAQIDAALQVGLLLVRHYDLKDVLGHDDIAPGRKLDPGPAFPMSSFRARLMGRQADTLPLYLATTKLNIRSGPGTEHATLPGSPLPEGARVAVLERGAVWWRVEVQDAASDETIEGWVHSRFLRPLSG